MLTLLLAFSCSHVHQPQRYVYRLHNRHALFNSDDMWSKGWLMFYSLIQALTFESINNLRVRNLNVQNSQQMHMAFQKCFAVQAINVRVTAPGHSPNTDGIHVTASKYVVIKHSTIGTGMLPCSWLLLIHAQQSCNRRWFLKHCTYWEFCQFQKLNLSAHPLTWDLWCLYSTIC